jgi:hypothetical protein
MGKDSGSAAARPQLQRFLESPRKLHVSLIPAALLTEVDSHISRLKALLPGETDE